jgi:hypothetical protein
MLNSFLDILFRNTLFWEIRETEFLVYAPVSTNVKQLLVTTINKTQQDAQ